MAKNNMSKLAKREEKLAYRLLLPTVLILVLIALYPLGSVFYTSFTDKTFAGADKETQFIGLENYKELLSITIKELPPILDENGKQKIDPKTNEPMYERAIRILPREPRRYKELNQFTLFGKRYVIGATDPNFISAIWNTLVFTVISVALETVLGLAIALVVNSNFKGRGIMRTVMLVPWAVITVVSAKMWEGMLQPNRIGFFNTVLDKLGIGNGQIAFLTTEGLQLPSIIAVDVWKTTPFMALLILAGLQLIPDTLYEAAEIDGASKLRQFFTITLPMLKPTIAVALVFRTLDALRVFDVFQVLLSSRKYSMATYNYFQLIGNRNMGLASAIGVIIFIFISIFAVIYIRMLGVDTDER
ncbi:carbohydrate ABC transporter permease [Thermohalobacter berrensis]|uniref:ABC transporter permease n=1 Tax=Thermohalobacter berrensis TaxID=99594 RepID=A0A419SWD9_9FIRM|nr:sugar ABC transporter permease [Thermohalobacter berrensis]RKD29536.1 ABC transporter permease [Thermohalobacter berrensis]